mmetsp:Transcript_2855/g.6068  ORF Transcript_2855/g.6068 Transcript_2855/m.6068 type:complete len:411 (-) Transcript_2855:36-1268(-)
MMLVLLACIYASFASVCSALIILQFDGSWRPSPRDPIPGFRSQTVQASFSNTAAASAALFKSDGNSADEERLFAIGAKSLSDARTSADAEYEGLLMGLDQLETALSSQDDDVLLGEHQELIIRGDCKAVIDQLNSRSNPRKTEMYYKQSIEKILRIRDCSSVTKVAFEHVPRESNMICDALCKLLLNIDQKRVVASVQDLICSGEEDIISNEKSTIPLSTNMRKRSMKKKSFRPKSKHYEVAMEEILNSSRICQSSRLALACLLSRSAVHTNDVAILLQLSHFCLQSSRMFAKIYWGDTSSITATKDALRTVSILCELLAMLFANAEEEAQKLKRKHKIVASEVEDLTEKLNEELDSIFELCTTNKNHNDALFPYSEVYASKLIDEVKYQQQLLEWNALANRSGVWLTIN